MKPSARKLAARQYATQAIVTATIASLLAACASAPVPNVRRDGQPAPVQQPHRRAGAPATAHAAAARIDDGRRCRARRSAAAPAR